MADSEKLADLSARLRSLANGDENTQETSKSLLLEAVVVLEQSYSLENSYVLVLIDAHSHPFINEIFNKSSNQNYPALDRDQPYNIRNRLYDAIRKQLIEISSAASLRTSRLVVRVYANSAKLENDLLCPLQQFTIQFSSMDPYFDFIGVRDEAIVEVKVADAFQTARLDPNCKHVFFAAWRRPVYLAMLRTNLKKVTLVHGNGMGAGANLVPLPCDSISIPEVFDKPAGKDSFSSLAPHSIRKRYLEKLISDKASHNDDLRSSQYVTPGGNGSVQFTASNATTHVLRQFGQLPRHCDAPAHHVPINNRGQRVDYHMSRPSPADKQAFTEKFGSGVRPCTDFHLRGVCGFGDDCFFSHSEISAQIRKLITYMVKRSPCSIGCACRRIDCIYGHVCQDMRCLSEYSDSCSMREFHGVIPWPVTWVSGESALPSPAVDADETMLEE